jgi:hypothetical protein
VTTACLGRLAVASLLVVGATAPAAAQVAADLLLLSRYGDRVYTIPRDQTRLYGRADLGWTRDGFALGGRFELDRTSDGSLSGTQYERLTQRWAAWRDERVHVRGGHFHTILGHGLLHRSYELPGVVYDEPGSGSRYAASRDMDGALLEVAAGPFAWRSFTGGFQDATQSPRIEAGHESRYSTNLTGAQAELRLPWNARVGAAALRSAPRGVSAVRRTFASGFAAVDALARWSARGLSAPLAIEYAREGGHWDDWWRFSRDAGVAHGLYASAGILWNGWSFTSEYKDLGGFRLGFNDPPPLVREHTWSLLNRNTHLLDAASERGHQWELNTPSIAWTGLTVSFARAAGQPPFQQPFLYEERFVEWRVAPPASDAWEARGYFDRGLDTHDFVSDRHAAGVSFAARLPRGFAGELDVERQRVVRAGFLATESFEDVAVTLGVSRSGWGSAGLSVVRTTDPLDRPSDLFGNPTASSATFTGATLAADLSTRHHAELFVGRRRGGRACVSGTCYDVPSLDGAELRWVSRFP